MSAKKIVILGPAYPLRGGIADFNESLAKALKNQGHEVVLYSFKFQYPKFLFPGKTQFRERAPSQNLTIRPEVHSMNPLNWGKVASKIVAEQPDLVITRFWLPVMGMSLGSICGKIRKKGIKVVAIVDNVIPHEKRPGDTQLTRFFMKRCDAFIGMSQSVINDLQQFTNSKNVKLIPHPIYNVFGEPAEQEEALRSLQLDQNRQRILFFGLIRAYKGLDILLKALPEILKQEPELDLIVAGEFYDEEEKYRNLVQELQLENHVFFHNYFIPDEQVKYYFAASDCVVQPYKSATQSGITQIAYNFNTPMIVSNVGGLPEIVENGVAGLVVDPNAKAFAQAVKTFYKNGGRPHYERGVIEGKKRFSWDYFLNGFWELVKKTEG